MQNCSYILADYIPVDIFNILVVVLLAIFIFSVFSTYKGRFFRVVGILVVVGGLANLVERVSTGCVYDPFNFLELFHFNYADVLITLGASLLIYRIFTKNEVS